MKPTVQVVSALFHRKRVAKPQLIPTANLFAIGMIQVFPAANLFATGMIQVFPAASSFAIGMI